MKKKKIVFVGLSGGVDSAVSAALLKKQGFEVVGVFIKTWHPDFLACNEEQERMDAMRVAAALDIPFLTFDFEDVYKKEVADYMIREYKLGRTPNPDVMCNKEVKFGAFLKKALSMGADFVATGHYAKAEKMLLSHGSHSILNMADRALVANAEERTSFQLAKGNDPAKDQSYFLWTLRQEQLKKILFPIGDLKKTEVRKLAKKFKLSIAEKKDSQGICFLGAVDLKEFLKHYIKEKKGKVLLAPQEAGNENGKEIGFHDGEVFYTLGERHGFTITKKTPTDGAYYVVDKDIKKNILYVSQDKNYLKKSPDIFLLKNSSRLAPSRSVASFSNSFSLVLSSINWISKIPEQNKTYTAQIRYHGEFLSCKIICGSKASAQVIFEKPVLVASGQSCVIYDGNVCLGGGVVV
ncbi:MAG: tRNA 2-thiouridine(34) synthase MnmA [Candidatus Pacebacteria bacterium]|nr:tRNA 2-thiouridine(34) synthase MnmA [Candidatus Paceibacterota bacterium]